MGIWLKRIQEEKHASGRGPRRLRNAQNMSKSGELRAVLAASAR
jgi:hypothetical protein